MKFNNYDFWTSLSAGLVVVAGIASKAFGFEVSEQIVTDIVMGIAGVLVVLGVVKMPKAKNASAEKENDIKHKGEEGLNKHEDKKEKESEK